MKGWWLLSPSGNAQPKASFAFYLLCFTIRNSHWCPERKRPVLTCSEAHRHIRFNSAGHKMGKWLPFEENSLTLAGSLKEYSRILGFSVFLLWLIFNIHVWGFCHWLSLYILWNHYDCMFKYSCGNKGGWSPWLCCWLKSFFILAFLFSALFQSILPL